MMILYQTVHLSAGFIREPTGQLKVSLNVLLFDKGPKTLNLKRE